MKCESRSPHEADGTRQSRPRRTGCTGAVGASHRVTHHYRGSARETERHHEGDGGQVQGDLVCRNLRGSEPAHHEPHETEHAVLQLMLRTDRGPEQKHPGEGAGIADAGSNGKEHRAQLTPAQGQKQSRHDPAAHRRGPGGAHCPEARHAKVAVDQDPVESRVDEVGDQDRSDDRTKPPEGLQALPKYDEGEEAEGAGDETRQ